MALVKLNLTDIGPYRVPLVYDTAAMEIMQDPAWVAKNAPEHLPNVYGPADVFRAPDGRIVDYHEALAMALSQAKLSRSVSQQQRQTSASSTVPGTQDTTATAAKSPAESAAAATGTTLDQLVKFLKRPIWPDDPRSLSTGVVLGGLALIWYLASGKRRR